MLGAVYSVRKCRTSWSGASFRCVAGVNQSTQEPEYLYRSGQTAPQFCQLAPLKNESRGQAHHDQQGDSRD